MEKRKRYNLILNPNWHELWKQEKCSSLAPPRDIFYKTQWACQGVKLTRLMSIFTSKKVWKLLIKIQLTKPDPKRTRGWKVPCLMQIRVKTLKAFQHLGHLDECSFSWNLLSIRGFFLVNRMDFLVNKVTEVPRVKSIFKWRSRSTKWAFAIICRPEKLKILTSGSKPQS